MSIRKAGIAALLMSAGFAATPVMAQSMADRGPYVGGSLGRAEAGEFCSNDGFAGTISNCEDTDTGWKAFVGYRFNRNFAAELSYINFGEYRGA